MQTIENFFTSVTIGKQFVDYITLRGRERFSKWLPNDCANEWACILSKFVLNPPLTYWNEDIVDKALHLLEIDTQKTLDAIDCRYQEIDNGIDNLFRASTKKQFENSLDLNKASDILLLAHEIHPDYLFIVEHIFGNLIILYRSVARKKGINGKFDLVGTVNILKDLGFDILLGGYDEKVRNAIAHGQVYFRGINIQYGELQYKYELAPFEFFERYDLLWQTCVSIAISLFIFLARNKATNKIKLPISINRLLASSFVERNDFEIRDYMISELEKNGFQLHVLIATTNFSRGTIIKDCVHFAIGMYRLNEFAVKRILFDIEYSKKTLSGLLIIDFQKLKLLLDSSAPFERINEVIESNLLWYDEKIKPLRRRMILQNIKLSASYAYWKVYFQNEKYLQILPIDIYRIKQVKKISAGGIPIIEIRAALLEP